MWLPLVGLLVGVVIGLTFSISLPAAYARYTGVAILAALDSVLGAIAAELDKRYQDDVFWTGLISNMLLAGLLTYLGDRLGVELYFAAIVAFGARLFNNLAVIRRHFVARLRTRSRLKPGA
ncbi:MAG TPA: small basic family protein [Chloroflexota bacterium]